MRPIQPRSCSSFEAALAPDALRAAWRKVRANGGGAGGDGLTLEGFARKLDERLARLAREMADGRYRPGPLRHVMVEKRSGGLRRLSIPTIADRVAQTAVLLAIVPAIDLRMADESFAYRPGRSVAQALARARALVAAGHCWALDADIERFFDSVPHKPLLVALTAWIDEPRLLALIALWLRSFAPAGRGLPQGAPLSPLLANLYLHPLDRLLAAAGIAAVRYADDFLALSPSRWRAWRSHRIAAGALATLGLRLNPAKTRIVRAPGDIVFLGERLAGGHILIG